MTDSLHGLLLESAERTPSAIALEWREEQWSYEAFVGRVASLAASWVADGVEPGVRIAISLSRGPECLAAIYAASWLGCPYAPLDVTWPLARIAGAVEEFQAGAWVVTDSLRGAIIQAHPGWSPPSRQLHVGQSGGVDVSLAPSPSPGGEQPAYALFTSGSTGRPKGVMHSHASALAFIEWARETSGLTSRSRVGGHASVAFDLSTYDVFATAAAGACYLPVPEAMRYRGRLLANFIRQRQLTHWYSVPAAWPPILEALRPEELFALDVILFAGESFPLPALRRLREAAPDTRLLNLYGPTETNVVTWHEVAQEDLEGSGLLRTIGTPCPGVAVSVLDEDGADASEGTLHVSGPTMMLGYVGREPQRGAYNTGDLVTQGGDGLLRFRGRRDGQLKIRGVRVEVGEIEAACARLPGVTGAVVVPILDGGQVCCVVAHITPATIDPEHVLARCRELLPGVAIPRQVWTHARFPRTANGKVDRPALATAPPSSC